MISINYRDPRPIYEQIKFSLRRLILSGTMQPDERLPSVRELSAQLAVNPNTVQRAYRELETEGYICSVPGRGSFVSKTDAAVEQRKAELLEKFKALARELRLMGVTDGELMALLRGGNEQ